MRSVDKLNNSHFSLISLIGLSSLGIFGFVNHLQAAELEIIGNVTKGTCSFLTSDMEVKFNSAIITSTVNDDINDRTHIKPFSLKYNCTGFDVISGNAKYSMKIAAGSGTSIDANNKIYPTTNLTKAAFILRKCDENKGGCSIIDLHNGGVVPFDITSNSDLESHFEVSVIKLGAETPNPGALEAAVDVTLLQP